MTPVPGTRTETAHPTLWSGHQSLAYSGLSGPTDWAHALTARLLPDELGIALDIESGVRIVFRLSCGDTVLSHLPGDADDSFAAWHLCRVESDLVAVELGGWGDCRLSLHLQWVAPDLIRVVAHYAASASDEAILWVELAADACRRADSKGLVLNEQSVRVTSEPPCEALVAAPDKIAALMRGQGRGSRHYLGQPKPQSLLLSLPLLPDQTVQLGLAFGLEQPAPSPLDGDGLNVLLKAPTPEPLPGILRNLAPNRLQARDKAIAILRGCTFAPQGQLGRRWVVSQREHQAQLSTYHAPFIALGCLTFDPSLAADLLQVTLAQLQANGQMPELAWPDGQSLICGPPLLCWAFWNAHRVLGGDLLTSSASRLKDFVKFPLASRLLGRMGHARSRGARFLTWGRGEGSNMDNSPRFDINEPFAAVDFTAYCAAEIEHISRIIEAVSPEHREAVHLGWMGEELGREMREYFWDESQSFFVDRYPDDDPVAARTVAGLIPLFAGVASDEQAAALVERHIHNPERFWTPLPLASLSADDPRCDMNMWRGGVFPGLNLLLVLGLRRYGYEELAAELRERTLASMARWYDQTGTLWEFYDAHDQLSPADLSRGRRAGALPEHAWSAASYLCLLHDSPDGNA